MSEFDPAPLGRLRRFYYSKRAGLIEGGITDRKEIEQKVKGILADRLDIDIKKMKLDSDLLNDLGMDSFGAVEIGYEIEEVFSVDIPEEVFNQVRKVKDIVDYIDKHLLENKKSTIKD